MMKIKLSSYLAMASAVLCLSIVVENGIAAPTAVQQQATPDAALQKQIEKRDAKVTTKTNTREMTIVGEVVDTWCYCSQVMGDGRGEAHKKCARLCVGGGVTAGIVTDDGTLYIAAKYQAYKGCAGLLLPYVAKRVRAKGWVAERGGCKVMKITSVEEVK